MSEVKSKNIYQRMNDVMKVVSQVHKGKVVSTGGGGGYKAVQHDDVTRLLQPELVKNGIYVSVTHTRNELEQMEVIRKAGQPGEYKTTEYQVSIDVRVSFINIDSPEEKITVNGYAYAMDNGDKAAGKALSMAVKNILLKNFMLESCDDEESRDNEKDRGSVKPKGASIGYGNDPSEKQKSMIFAITKTLYPERDNSEINSKIASIKSSKEASDIISKLKDLQDAKK